MSVLGQVVIKDGYKLKSINTKRSVTVFSLQSLDKLFRRNLPNLLLLGCYCIEEICETTEEGFLFLTLTLLSIEKHPITKRLAEE